MAFLRHTWQVLSFKLVHRETLPSHWQLSLKLWYVHLHYNDDDSNDTNDSLSIIASSRTHMTRCNVKKLSNKFIISRATSQLAIMISYISEFLDGVPSGGNCGVLD